MFKLSWPKTLKHICLSLSFFLLNHPVHTSPLCMCAKLQNKLKQSEPFLLECTFWSSHCSIFCFLDFFSARTMRFLYLVILTYSIKLSVKFGRCTIFSISIA